MANLILYYTLSLFILFTLIAITIYMGFLIYSSLMGAPYVPTSKKIIEEILARAMIKKNKIFFELGCGDGRISRLAAKKYQVKAIGIDVNILLVFLAKIKALRDGVANKTFFSMKNIFDIDYSNADYLYIFLMPRLIAKIAPKLKKELKRGTVVISHGFPIDQFGKKPIAVLKQLPFPTYYYKI